MIGKNQEILDTLKRIIEANTGWQAIVSNDEVACYTYLLEQHVDIVLLSSGLSEDFEITIRQYAGGLNKGIKVIIHYGGGSGLLKSEVYALFPEWIPK